MARALAAAIVVSLLAVSGAGGIGRSRRRSGGTVVFALPVEEPACLNPFDERCPPGTSPFTLSTILGRVLESAFDVGPGLHLAAATRFGR